APQRAGRSGGDPPGAGAGQQRRDGQAHLVDQVGGGQLAEQVRASFAEDVAQAPLAQQPQGQRQVGRLVPGGDHVGGGRQGLAAVGGRRGAGEHHRPYRGVG